jgi:hypothetical protein
MADQNLTAYEPTKKEQSLLAVLLNPANRLKTVTEVCQLAECSREFYYNTFHKPGFVEYYRRTLMDLVKREVGQVVNTFLKEAKRGSYQHGKVILEMADMYTEKVRQEHTGADGGPIEVSTADLVAKARALVAQVDKHTP